MASTYAARVTDHVIHYTHAAPQPFPTITAAKDYAAALLRRIYDDPNGPDGDEVSDAVESLITRINTHRGPITEHDPYLDCTVAIYEAHQAAVADSAARIAEEDADILNELRTR